MSSSNCRYSPFGSDSGYLPVCIGSCLERACCAAAAAWLMLSAPTVALAAPEPPPYQQANQTPETQKAKTAPLSQDKQSAATDSSSQLPPLPTSFPLLPDIVVQAPQEVSPQQACLFGCRPLTCYSLTCYLNAAPHGFAGYPVVSLLSTHICPVVSTCITVVW